MKGVSPPKLSEILSRFCSRPIVKVFLFIGGLVLFCEVFFYYVVLLQCTWPLLDDRTEDANIFVGRNSENPLKVMMIADTHLLGPFRGHWFDKMRREWQMARTFSTAMTLHKPDVVVFLGDLFDEGQWMDSVQFNRDVQRFHKLFPQSGKTQFLVAVGNHDVGFHYTMRKQLLQRFQRMFSKSLSGVELITVHGNAFIILNSMALEGDNCSLCREAENEIERIENILNCSKRVHRKEPVLPICEKFLPILPHYTRPIVLQHFPLFRSDDSKCQERDVPVDSKPETYRESWEVLSQKVTKRILDMEPRAVFDGHSHHSCFTSHNASIPSGKVPEWTLPSFNWRNKNNPSFVLAVFTPNNFAVSRCYMPKESTVIALYVTGMTFLIIWIVLYRRRQSSRYQGFSKLPIQKS